MSKNWNNDAIQFPRLIAELEMAGAITPMIYDRLRESMDLTNSEINELIERAQAAWDAIKARTK
jgi:hypothetical protein